MTPCSPSPLSGERVGERGEAAVTCVVPEKPPMPHPETRADCEALGGTWEDHWTAKHQVPSKWAPDGGLEELKTGWQVLGRGNRRYRGCTNLPAPDVGRPCAFPFDCLGDCQEGACSARVAAHNGLGCGPWCTDGKLNTMCRE